jgi:hypothetical protein
MTTGATSLLGLALPVNGELSGTWGDVVNYGITDYVDIAVAGTLTLTGDGAVTLANTTGTSTGTNITSTTAQYAIIKITGTLTTTKIITAPSYSKTYVVDNAATGGTVTFKASGQTGVSVAVGEKCTVYFNGTDYVKVATSTGTGSVTAVSVASSNGFAGTSSGGATPALTLSTSITGVLKGNGTAISAAAAGTDYLAPPSGTALLKANSGGALANATAGTDYIAPPSGTAILKANSGGALANATAGTDYLAPGGALGTPSSGTLSGCTVDGTNSVGYRNVPPVGTKTGSYTLATADIGKYVQIGSGGSITIPNSTFAEGDIVSLFNNTSGAITITCTITTAYIAGTYTDKATMTLAAAGVATILFISGTLCVVSGNVS